MNNGILPYIPNRDLGAILHNLIHKWNQEARADINHIEIITPLALGGSLTVYGLQAPSIDTCLQALTRLPDFIPQFTLRDMERLIRTAVIATGDSEGQMIYWTALRDKYRFSGSILNDVPDDDLAQGLFDVMNEWNSDQIQADEGDSRSRPVYIECMRDARDHVYGLKHASDTRALFEALTLMDQVLRQPLTHDDIRTLIGAARFAILDRGESTIWWEELITEY